MTVAWSLAVWQKVTSSSVRGGWDGWREGGRKRGGGVERWRESGCQRRNERQETAVHKCPCVDAHRAPCPGWSLVRWTHVSQLSLDGSKSDKSNQ